MKYIARFRVLAFWYICSIVLNINALSTPLHPHGHFPDENLRTESAMFNPELKPFCHGVASGDPLQNNVIIWTRVTTEVDGPAEVDWYVFSDVDLSNVVHQGTFVTDQSRDYTVKVDVGSLEPNTTYYYAFRHDGMWSISGRTKTLPESTDNVKLAVVSCVNYQWGYFNALENIAKRADLDAVLHMGDYFYEYPIGDYAHPDLENDRQHEPSKETVELADYRIRFSQYRLDPMLMEVHRQHPMIAVWDDHESTNDSWSTGADNHDASEGSWEVRKDNSTKAYSEWMPIRDKADRENIYRSFDFGGLLELFMLETRLLARDEPIAPKAGGTTEGEVDTLDWQRQDRTMLGVEQKEWLKSSLVSSKSTWKVVGSSVVMSHMPVNLLFNFDAWDGYPAERRDIFNTIRDNNIQNFGAVSGDIHMSFGQNIMDDSPDPISIYDTINGNGSLGFEFTTPSVTSANLNELPEITLPFIGTINPLEDRLEERSQLATIIEGTVKGQVPWLRYINTDSHGYLLLEVTNSHIQADWMHMDRILERESDEKVGYSLRQNTNSNEMVQAESPIMDRANPPVLASDRIPNSINEEDADFITIGNYPNPASDVSFVNFAIREAGEVSLVLSDSKGKVLLQTTRFYQSPGIFNLPIDVSDLASGKYYYKISTGSSVYTRSITVLR